MIFLFIIMAGISSHVTASHPLNFLAITSQEEEESESIEDEDEEEDMIIIPDVSN